MRNGQILLTTSKEMKTAATTVQPDSQKKTPATEKITSFSNPRPSSPPPPMVSAAKSIVESSKIASGSTTASTCSNNRITLSRKPPVWKEKPRIPIKPQTVLNATAAAAATSSDSTQPEQPVKTPPAETAIPGQMSVRFVHLTPAPPAAQQEEPGSPSSEHNSLPPLISAQVEQETSAQPLAVTAVVEINNNPAGKSLDPPPSSEETLTSASGAATNPTTRGMTRTAFEALRANLAGTLELSRVSHSAQPQRASMSTKRQAPPAPEEAIVSSSPDVALDHAKDKTTTTTTPSVELETAKKSHPERAQSASPHYRNSLFCPSPDGFDSDSPEEVDPQPRSVSLTRIDRPKGPSGVNLTPKPPSIRKMIRDRATQFLQRAESGAKNSTSAMRLSRSERFAAEGSSGGDGGNSGQRSASKKGKNRFSIRRLLGLRKDSGSADAVSQSPAEPLPPKVRPEIVHPVELQGQVEVVSKAADAAAVTAAAVAMADALADSGSTSSSSQPSSLQSCASGKLFFFASARIVCVKVGRIAAQSSATILPISLAAHQKVSLRNPFNDVTFNEVKSSSSFSLEILFLF